jgi:hypothetical protein
MGEAVARHSLRPPDDFEGGSLHHSGCDLRRESANSYLPVVLTLEQVCERMLPYTPLAVRGQGLSRSRNVK